nr:PREDICTED: uncharacterized protein LOC105671540 isoform X2 [Linepithema humile]
MSEIIVTKENVWQYYEKLSDWVAKCKFCANKYMYIDDRWFYEHIQRTHQEIFEYETYEGRQEWPWIYFKYAYSYTHPLSNICTLYLKCLLCGVNCDHSTIESLVNHLRNHSNNKKELEDYVFHDWVKKYCTKCTDFTMDCNLCFLSKYNFSLENHLNEHITTHSDNLGNELETYDIVTSLEYVQDSKIIEIQTNMWEYYYNNLPYFQAKCKFCVFQCCYVDIINLHSHIETEHKKIFDCEKILEGAKSPWMYFKYSYQYISNKYRFYSICLICGVIFPFTMKSLKNHLTHQHSDEELKNYTGIFHDWIWKYCRQSDDNNEVKCNICCKNVSVYISTAMYHAIKEHPEELQRNISKKKTQKLWQNYIDLKDFQAKCRFCNFQFYYINTTNFSEHVKEKHVEINKHEEAYGEKWPFKYFKYLNSVVLQCCL